MARPSLMLGLLLRRARSVVLLLAAGVALTASTGARAQAPDPATAPLSPVTPEPPPDSPATSVPPGPEEPPHTTTPGAPSEPPPTSAPEPGPRPSGPSTTTLSRPGAAAEAGDGGDAAVRPGTVPPDAQRVINSVRRSRSNSTRKLLDAVRNLQLLGISEDEAVATGFGRFPVGGFATFSHDWLFPRFVPTFHLHKGTDIFAVTGTPARAPADGTLKLSQGAVGGLAAYVYEPDGTYYYLAHLRGFVPGQRSGQPVKVGEVIGYVGDSGNAQGGSPHVHFEIHPAPTRTIVSGRGANRTERVESRPVPVGTVLPAVDPKPYLDRWLEDALAALPKLVGSAESRPRALVATGLTRRVAGGQTGAFPAPVTPSRSQLLWAVSGSPAGGALALAEAEAMTAATELDWSLLARRAQARLADERQAAARATALLEPLTPDALRRAGNEG